MLDSISQKVVNLDEYVTPLPRFHTCLIALASFFELIYSPIIVVRSAICILRIYGFVDASGSGFGGTLLEYYKIRYRIGTWSRVEDDNSSNRREFENLVCTVEEEGGVGMLI